MKIGYIRVSTEEQREDRQIDLLEPVCDEIHIEKRSAVGQSRPVFEAVLQKLDAGDTLVVWSLDRAFRSARDALNIEAHLKEREVALRIVSVGVDTATGDGKSASIMVAAWLSRAERILKEQKGLAVPEKREQLGQRQN